MLRRRSSQAVTERLNIFWKAQPYETSHFLTRALRSFLSYGIARVSPPPRSLRSILISLSRAHPLPPPRPLATPPPAGGEQPGRITIRLRHRDRTSSSCHTHGRIQGIVS